MIFDLIFINKILLVLISTTGTFLAFWVYFADRKNRINQTFFWFVLSAVIWISLDYSTSFPNLFPYALLMARIEWATIAIFLIFAYFFSIYFPKESKRYPVLDKTVIGTEIIFFFLAFSTDTVIKSIEPIPSGGVRYILGPGGIIDLITMVPLTIMVFGNIFKKYFTLHQLEKLRVQYFLIGLSICAVANLIFNVGVMLLWKESQTISYLGTSSFIFLFGFTAYAIVKHELFGIKVVLTTLLVGVIAILLLINVLVSVTILDYIWKGSIFFLFLIFGYFLIESVLREVRQKELLEEKVRKRTKELQSAFEEIKKKKNDLEKVFKVVVGRELKMIELKEKIKELEERKDKS